MESHSAHSWKRLTRAIVAVVVVAAVAVGVWWLWPKPLDTSHTKVEISASSKFTDAQLDDLVQASYRANAGMKNCSVDKVKYDERQSEDIVDMEIDSYDEGHGSALGRAVREHGRDGAAVLFVDMTCQEHVETRTTWNGTCCCRRMMARKRGSCRIGGTAESGY